MAYGNLAYKYEYRPEYEEPQLQTAEPVKNPKKAVQAQRRRYFKYIVRIVTLALAAVFMVSTFVTVHDTRSEVRNLEAQLKDMEALTNQKSFELEHSFDLTQIEEEATSRLGMQRPENYQYVYVNVKQEDVTEKTASSEEGPLKRAAEVMSGFFNHIVGIFSIE